MHDCGDTTTQDASAGAATAHVRPATDEAEVLRGLVERLVTDPAISASRALRSVRALLEREEQAAGLDPDPSDATLAVQLLEHGVAERTKELSALLEVSRSLASTLDLERLLDAILDQVQVVARYDGAVIAALEGETVRVLRRRAPTPLAPAASAWDVSVQRERAAPAWDRTLRREPVIIGDVRGDEPLARAYRAALDVPLEQSPGHYVRSWMAVPLALTDRVIGRIVLCHGRPGYYTPHHAELVTAIATQAATAIENARLYGEAQAAREAAAR